MLPQRFTFISDPTNEFPNNTNQKFKVRLPLPLPLQLDRQWEASLWSLSVPDQELENKIVFQDTSQVILDFKFTIYRLGGWSSSARKYTSVSTKAVNETLTIKDVMNESTPAQTGVEFWKNCLRMMDETVMREALEVKTDYSDFPVAVPQAWKPTFKWDGDDLTLEAVSKDNVVTSGGTPYSWFAMSTKLAESFGFIQYSKLFKTYILADNASVTYPLYDEKGTSISPGILTSTPGLKGPTRAVTLTPDVDTTDPKLATAKFENKMYFSRAVQWTFRRLNESFDKLHNGKEVVMVYTDLVQSTMVGNGRFPLLRKLSVDRQGSARVTVEPYHREWVPLQTNWIEVVEFQLSTPGGELTHLSPGKTLITVGLQRRL